MEIKTILNEFKERLTAVYKDNLKGLILFGSTARGEMTEESDIDVLVVLENISNYEDDFNKIFQIEREVEKKYDDRIIISSTIATFTDYSNALDPLYLNIKKEGVPV